MYCYCLAQPADGRSFDNRPRYVSLDWIGLDSITRTQIAFDCCNSLSHTSSFSSPATFDPDKCSSSTLNFNFFHAYDQVTDETLAAYGFAYLSIRTSSDSSNCETPLARVFDTARPTCGDGDLTGAPDDGKAIIVQEKSRCGGADDCADGGTIEFDWNGALVNLRSMRILDMDEAVEVSVKIHTHPDWTVLPAPSHPGNGQHVTYDFGGGVDSVTQLRVHFVGSGGIPSLTYTKCEPIVHGDPHFKTWAGHKFDYHGQCDLLLVHAPHFQQGQGLDLQVRTEQRSFFSFVSRVAIKIGNDILEVGYRDLLLNGALHDNLPVNGSLDLSGYPVTYTDEPFPNGRAQKVYTIQINSMESIRISVFNHFMAIRFLHINPRNYRDATGLYGDYNSLRMLARDGTTVLQHDPDQYGAEWQVNDQDAQLFAQAQAPQYPQACRPAPSIADGSRHLRHGITKAQARDACQRGMAADIGDCVFDVMATGDLGMVHAHFF